MSLRQTWLVALLALVGCSLESAGLRELPLPETLTSPSSASGESDAGVDASTDGPPANVDTLEPGEDGGAPEEQTEEPPEGVDACPEHPETEPGPCGCGFSDLDGDGVEDCLDGCPQDGDKQEPGLCGCGNSDADADGDGAPDCMDACPGDPNKDKAGVCGCGVSEADTDGDGRPDCDDGCPNDPNKVRPQACGCGVPEVDEDEDGIVDCNDACVATLEEQQAGACCPPDATDCGEAPRVNFLAPIGQPVLKGQFGIEVAAFDPDGSVQEVFLYIDGEFFRGERLTPYQWGRSNPDRLNELNRFGPGEVLIEAIALDNEGFRTSASMRVTIEAPDDD